MTTRVCAALSVLVVAGSIAAQPAQADPFAGLVAWWSFNGSGADNSGHGYDLNLVGAPTFAPGIFGRQALSLDGTGNQYAIRPIDDAVFNLGSSDFTIQIWANFNESPNNREQTLIEKFSGQAGPGWTFTTPGNTLQFYPAITSAPRSFPANQWDQYVVERSGTQISLFIDGTLIATAPFVGAFSSSPNPLLIGKRNPGDGRNFAVNGLLEDAAIWNRALSEAEIQSLHDNGFQPSEVPEPASLLLLGTGLIAGAARWRKRWTNV